MNKLPPRCYVNHPASGKVVGILRGERGCYPVETRRTADELNEILGVTPAQREAMLAGSVFGWHCPGANPENYDETGAPKLERAT